MAVPWSSLALVLVSIVSQSTVWPVSGKNYDWQWRPGRSTFYGTDSGSIHTGSCNYGYLYQSDPLGWDVAALNDGNPYYEDSCGTCFEVQCDPVWVTDSYNGSYDRTTACFDPTASLIVRITDVCPCTYPPNFYSNKRWCCNDMEHLDMAVFAFEKLASLSWGVIGVQYRSVPCTYQPQKPAKNIPNSTPGTSPPEGAERYTNIDTSREGYEGNTYGYWCHIQGVMSQGVVKMVRDWPDMSPSTRADSMFLYRNSFQNGFYDSSWTADVMQQVASANNGMRGGAGLCANIHAGGAVALKGWNGAFSGRVGLKFFAYVGYTGYNGNTGIKPNILINLAGDKGGCSPLRLVSLNPIYFEPFHIPYSSDYFWGWQVYFPVFDGDPPSTVINSPSSFGGCGFGNEVNDLTTVQLLNAGNYDQWICVDHIELI